MKTYRIDREDPENPNSLVLMDAESGERICMAGEGFIEGCEYNSDCIRFGEANYVDEDGNTGVATFALPIDEVPKESLEHVMHYLLEHETRSFEEEFGYAPQDDLDGGPAEWAAQMRRDGHTDHILYDAIVLLAWLGEEPNVDKSGS